MKSVITFVAISATLLVMSSCGRAPNEENDAKLRRELASNKDVTTDSAVIDGKTAETLPDRKFIRTSDMKFRVKDVRDATTQIENITRQHNGFVTYTDLKSNIENQETIQKSMDSSLESIRYSVVNDITLRVPNATLDSTMAAIATLVDYMDYRVIKADDVALQIKSNQKAQARALRHDARIAQAVDTRKGKIHEAVDAVETSAEQQRMADDAELSNLSLADQVAYSTVSLSIYQRTETKYWSIANPDSKVMKSGMGIRIWDAIKTGWYIMEDIFVGILNLWFLVVLGIIGFWIYRRYAGSKKKIAIAAK
jgi:hypothetical protein